LLANDEVGVFNRVFLGVIPRKMSSLDMKVTQPKEARAGKGSQEFSILVVENDYVDGCVSDKLWPGIPDSVEVKAGDSSYIRVGPQPPILTQNEGALWHLTT